MSAGPPIVLIVGPTAGGKTALALELARRLPGSPGGECLGADSMQIYRGMDIGTAKPTPDQRAAIPHHLLDLIDPSEDGFSVDRWLTLADESIARIRGRGRYPIVVGGTNLYVQALLEGMFEGPEPDPALRSALEATDSSVLRRRLEQIDPPAAMRIHPNDRRRAIRAIEVHELTGRRISDLQRQWFVSPPRDDVLMIGLDYSAPAINRRINARVREMFESGFVEEVTRLRKRGPLGRQASEALGYKQIIAVLEGRMSLDEAVEEIKIRTRRLAKQQRTWLRRFRSRPGSVWLEADEKPLQVLADQALATILAFWPDRESAATMPPTTPGPPRRVS